MHSINHSLLKLKLSQFKVIKIQFFQMKKQWGREFSTGLLKGESKII